MIKLKPLNITDFYAPPISSIKPLSVQNTSYVNPNPLPPISANPITVNSIPAKKNNTLYYVLIAVTIIGITYYFVHLRNKKKEENPI